MKHIFVKGVFLSFLTIAGFSAQAQSTDKDKKISDKDKKTTIRVRVSEDGDGKSKEIEKEYHVKSMNDDERKEFVDKVLDSLGVDSKTGGKIVSVTVDDGDGDKQTMTRKRRNVIVDRRDDREPLVFNWSDDLSKDFNFDTEKLRTHMRNFERDFKPKARVMIRDMENFGDRLGESWSRESAKAASVRDLSVYSNNPDNGVLNLRFQVPQKGDLSIIVTDVKGKEVGKKDIKDFSGNFVGQIDLKKNTKGTVFVTVVQSEDGAVKRVVIP